MADAVLSVAITAEIDALRDSFNKAVRETGGFDKNTRTALASIDKGFADLANKIDGSVSKAATSTKKASNDISQSLAKSASITAQSGTAISKGSDKAAFALTNLGRVAQDAPFGFIGIQNNLNPLLESLQRLRQESGSNIGALKALGSSLIGPAGLGIALSVVSAGILIYQQYQQKANKATKEAEKATTEYKDTLVGLNKVIYEGQTSSGEEISRLSALFRATQNLSLSVNERAKAVKALQDKYPSYFSNLTTENALTSEATKNYNLLKQSIVATSLARAADKDTAKQGEKIFENLGKRKEVQKEINQLIAKNQELTSKDKDLANGRTLYGQAISFNNQKIKELTESLKPYDNAIKNANTSIYNNSQLQDAIVRKFGVQAIVTDKATTSTKELRKELEKLTGIDVAGIEAEVAQRGIDITKRVKPIIEGIIKQLDSEKEPIKLPIPVDPVLVGVKPLSPEDFNAQLGLDSLDEALADFADNAKNNIAPLISDTLTSLGEALSSGDFSQVGQNLLMGIAGFLGEFGKLLIKEGTANVLAGIAENIILPGSGAKRIAGGIGLIAAGGTVSIGSGLVSGSAKGGNKNQGYQIPGFATGVTNFSGGLAWVGERGPELVNLPTGSNVITNQNTQALIKSGNRSNTQTIIPDVRISGQDLVVVFNRAEKVNRRR